MVDVPLGTWHLAHGGIPASSGDAVVAHYGAPDVEYRALRAAAVAADLGRRELVHVRGKHWQRFLHGMLTADVKGMLPGQAGAGALVDATGGYIADFGLLVQPDGCLLDLPSAVAQQAVETLRKYVLALDVKLTAARELALLTVQGPNALSVVAGAGLAHAEGLRAPFAAAAAEMPWPHTIVAHTHTGEAGYDILVATTHVEKAWASLLAAGSTPAGGDALENARIEAGLPTAPVDLDERIIPLEVPLRHAISLSKGCYTGQEALAKMAHRGEPRRLLIGVKLPQDAAVPAPGTELWIGGKRAGWTTSATFSPTLGHVIALAHVKRRLAEPNLPVELGPEAGPRVEAVTATLPFVWGSGLRFPIPEL